MGASQCAHSIQVSGRTVQCERPPHSDDQHVGTSHDGKRVEWRAR